MAKVRERVAKTDTLDCYSCSGRYTSFERKSVLYGHQIEDCEFAVEDKDTLWEALQGYLTHGVIWCPGCEEAKDDDYDLFEKGQVVYECAACETWWEDSEQAARCCP